VLPARFARIATLALAVVAAASIVACSGTTPRATAPLTAVPAGSLSASADTAPTTLPAPATTVTTARATTTTAKPAVTTTAPPPIGDVPTMGGAGAQVMAVQQQLSALGYWLGTPDGHFGSTTQQAVFALQKAAGLPRSGSVDAATAAALAAGTKPSVHSTAGHVIEVDLTRQLVLITTDGHLDATLNTSTGGGYVYYDHGSRQVATTPTGHFTTTWQVDGTRVSSLGVLWRPKFFVGGIAIHGDSYVPAHAVSHGCVRVSNQAIDWIWSSNSDPIGTAVWVY
jgi:peptidoglycan hydrolase-like protein with peptidoglycan-binding domain